MLKKEGVSSILSIQTDEDFQSHSLSQEYLQEMCAAYGIDLHTYSIKDMNKHDFLSKCLGAIVLMRNLLRN